MYIYSLTDIGSTYEGNKARLGISVGFCKFCESLVMWNVKMNGNEVLETGDDEARGFAFEISYSKFEI